MIDDTLVQKLKDFIRATYQLVESPISEKSPFFGKNLKPHTRGIGTPPPSFETIADTLINFINKERNKETFSVMLERLREEKGMTAVQLYHGAWIKKQLYSKIMGERNYHPSKNTVIAFGLSLQLDNEKMNELLESAGFKFSNSSIADLVILFCMNQGLYNIHDVNALLLSVDQKVLCRE
jgi:hypothetical protein